MPKMKPAKEKVLPMGLLQIILLAMFVISGWDGNSETEIEEE